jgi:hypothetical protein
MSDTMTTAWAAWHPVLGFDINSIALNAHYPRGRADRRVDTMPNEWAVVQIEIKKLPPQDREAS